MPFLKQQIQILNDYLQAEPLSDKRFAGGRFGGLAIECSRQTEQGVQAFPAIFSSEHEPEEITPDDTYPITIYHKVISKTQYAYDGFGENVGFNEVYDMQMIVSAKYSAIKVAAEDLEALISIGLWQQVPKSKLSSIKLDTMIIKYVSTNLNSPQVFMDEYKGFPLFLSAEDILFSIKYTIESRFRKGCFTICDC